MRSRKISHHHGQPYEQQPLPSKVLALVEFERKLDSTRVEFLSFFLALEIKPCGLGSRIPAIEAESYN